MNAEIVRPETTGPWPAILVLPGIFGIGDGDRAFLARLAAEGYLAGAHRWSKDDPVEATLAGIGADLAELRGSPDAGPVALAGFCRGGTLAMMSALRAPWLAGTVVFYGDAREVPQLAEGAAHPLLLIHGDADAIYPVEAADALAAALAARGKSHEYLRIPGGPHAFFLSGMANSRPDLAEIVWPTLLSFLHTAFRG